MAKKYVNGYDKPSFKIIYPDYSETINLSFKYQALKEYYEKISVNYKLIDGAKKKMPKHIDYEWRLFYSDSIDKEDLIKIGIIENLEFNRNARILLTPHIDYAWRYFEVLIMDEKREIDLWEHGRGRDGTTNKGYEISFINKNPIYSVSIIDPDYLPVIGSIVGQEYN